ncbi:MAG: N-acetyltransferase [Betaproteobacteria bacterium]|nr:N-acetyltransferase [Betaproteobacteria bacterium]
MDTRPSTPPSIHRRDGDAGALVILRDGHRLGELLCAARAPGVVALNHTEVDQSLRGSGAARQPVQAAVTWARAQNARLVPRCGHLGAVPARTPNWQDVLQA